MIMTYPEFLENNRRTVTEDTATIIGVSHARNTCTCMNKDRMVYTLLIPILINDMMNGMCHINNASKLRTWNGWGKEIEYPKDYFNDIGRYVKEER